MTVNVIILDVITTEGHTWSTLHMADCPNLQLGEPGVNVHGLSAPDIETVEAAFRKWFDVAFETRRHVCVNRHLNEIDSLVTVTELADKMRVPASWLREQADKMESETPASEAFYTTYQGPYGEDKLSRAAELCLRQAIQLRGDR